MEWKTGGEGGGGGGVERGGGREGIQEIGLEKAGSVKSHQEISERRKEEWIVSKKCVREGNK